MRVTDLTLGILTLLGGLAIFWSARNFQVIPGQSYGAGTMPRAVAFVTVLVGLFIIGRALWERRLALGMQLAPWARSGAALGRVAMVLVLIVGYVLVSPVLGFVPTAFAVMTASMLILGTSPLLALATSAVATVAIQQSFGRLLLVPLPRSDFLPFLW
ncbi:tripartite tricarboxylate transporter TctB family protein [Palleronia pelagia]|uniref:Tripartite tricarboxylate transporter TctB family protein n=1 Tax=Palleronia pelagia TaxID=387096 RepID=A0A1H8DGZ5_9RHOB|nr:tripartite tricarboxylate transporter TctB family protein [Palleronia pelagia]SEN06559.1 Tripartite tricarboxylate transporter TctB family protein [Palleronia pelagia]